MKKLVSLRMWLVIGASGALLIVLGMTWGTGFLSMANDDVTPPVVNSEDDKSVVVKRGKFAEYATGIDGDYDISGTTEVKIFLNKYRTIAKSEEVTGLTPGVAYSSHVHLLACNDDNGGGHYQDIPGGPVDGANEIWPIVKVESDGIGKGKATVDFAARPDEVKSVVIHGIDGARIACADLEVDQGR